MAIYKTDPITKYPNSPKNDIQQRESRYKEPGRKSVTLGSSRYGVEVEGDGRRMNPEAFTLRL